MSVDSIRRHISRRRDLTDNFPPFTATRVDAIMYLNNCLFITDFDEFMSQDKHWSDFYD